MTTTLSFDIIGRDRSGSKVLTDVSKSAEKTSASLKGLKVAAAVGLVAVTAAAVKFGVSSVKAYAEAQTAQNKLQDAFAKFPKLADTNIASLRNLNTALAQKTRFDDDATASGQAVLAQFKLTGQQITQLTPLLQDYAAKTGKDLPTAARDLGKAMLGQGRSLKAVGINFKDTGTAGGNFSQIMSGLRTQVGGFAEKEGKTAAGQAEILKNQFGELEESAGRALLPALLKISGGLLKVVNGFNGLSDASKTTILSIGGGIVTVGLSALAIGKLAVTIKAARDAFNALSIASKRAVIGIPVIGLALAAVGAAIGFFAGQAQKAKDRTEAIGEALKGMTGEVTRNTAALDQNVRASTAKALQDAGALDAATKLGLGLDTLTNAALGNQTAIAEVHAKLLAAYRDGNSQQVQAASKLSGSFGSVSKSVGDAIAKEQQYRAAVGGVGGASAAAGVSVEGAGKKVKTAGEKAADAKKKLQDLAASMFNASKGALALSGSEISFQQAIDDATHAAKQNGKTLDTNTQKGRDNKTSLNNLVTASQAYISKLVETGKSSKRVTAATADARAEFVRVAQKMGLSSAAAKDLAAKYFKIPKKVETKTSAPGMKDTTGAVKKLHDGVQNLRGKNVSINFDTNAAALAKRYKITVAATKVAANERKATLRARGGLVGKAVGGILPGNTPLWRGDDIPFPMAKGGIQPLRGGEGIYVTEAMRDPYERRRLHAVNQAALGGQPLRKFQEEGLAGGGIAQNTGAGITRNIRVAASGSIRVPRFDQLRDNIATGLWAGLRAPLLAQLTQQFRAEGQRLAKAAALAAGGGGGPIGKGGYASALGYARRHAGHPYVYGSLWDCSGFMSALHSIILGQSPHRRYTTTAFHGAHAAGFTRGKSSPFMVGVRPLAGKFGHMAGTLNGVNVESAGGVGVRVGGSARGAHSGMFSWRGGLAGGGVIRVGRNGVAGDLPFDLLDPQGQRYNPELADLLHRAGYHRGGSVGERGPERILSPAQNRNFENLVRAMDRRGGATVVHNHYTVNAPHYVGNHQDLVTALVQADRRGQLAVIKRSN